MHCFRMSGLLRAAQTFSFEAGMRRLSLICIFVSGSLPWMRVALSPAPLESDLGEDRHRDLFRRDGAEVEPGRRLDAIDRGRTRTVCQELGTQCRHLAAAADKGVIGGIDPKRLFQRGLVALALRRHHDKAAGLMQVAE